jgi:1-acyl-sn-glycerol-3-phosphate acyltransferase
MAAEAGVPVLPMRVTYREPKGLWKRLRRRPFLTLNVLPPIWPDRTLAPRAQSLALMAACREAMERVG